eukprot:350390-Chlamydomonas_euryale.AAC.5
MLNPLKGCLCLKGPKRGAPDNILPDELVQGGGLCSIALKKASVVIGKPQEPANSSDRPWDSLPVEHSANLAGSMPCSEKMCP